MSLKIGCLRIADIGFGRRGGRRSWYHGDHERNQALGDQAQTSLRVAHLASSLLARIDACRCPTDASDQQTAPATTSVTGWRRTLQDNVKIETIAAVIVAEEHPVMRIGNVAVYRQGVEMVRQIGTGER